MVKLGIFSAWADLQIASQEHFYLDDVVRPHLVTLTPLWLAALREYARLRFEPDVTSSGASAALAGGLDTVYAALNRETLLKVCNVASSQNMYQKLTYLVLPICMATICRRHFQSH